MLKRSLFIAFFAVFPFQLRPVAGTELIAGAIVYKILSTQAVRTMGAVMAGYFLNSSAGKQFSGKMKDFALKKIFSNHQVNNFRLTSNSDLGSYFYTSNLLEKKPNFIDNFSKSENIQAIKQRLNSMESFSKANTKLSSFYSKTKDIGSRFVSSEKIQKLIHQKNSGFYKEENKSAGQFMAQQVKGFCPKIENNFYSDSYWKGFAQGSFASWLSAWFLFDDKKEKKEQVLNDQKPIVIYVNSVDLIRDELIKQAEVPSIEFGAKMS